MSVDSNGGAAKINFDPRRSDRRIAGRTDDSIEVARTSIGDAESETHRQGDL